MGCEGLHCPGCGHGGGKLAALVVVLVFIGGAAWRVRHGIETGLQIAMWTLVGAVSLAVIGGAVYVAMRVRARQLEVRAPHTVPMPARVVRLGAEPDREAIEARRWPVAGQWEQIKPSNERENYS